MKKVLFATTAIVAFAGAASADVAVSGYAEMGIADTDSSEGGVSTDTQDAGFYSALDVYFDMTGETDGGITFGASIDLEDAAETGGNNADTFGNAGADYTVFVSGAFGTLTMGDTDGALDWAMTEAGNVGNPGTIADNETTHAGYLGAYGDGAGDNTVLRYDYSVGDFGMAVSVEQSTIAGGNPVVPTTVNPTDGENGYAVGLRYSMDMGGASVALGAGIQKAVFDGASGYGPVPAAAIIAGDEADIVGVSVAVTSGAFQAGVTFTQHDFEDAAGVAFADVDHIGVGVGYTAGALSLHANYGEFDGTGATAADIIEADGFGIAAAYDLGGGATAHFGYNDSDTNLLGDLSDASSWSLGLSMAF
ncbi:porin [Thalassobacter stenotrophicus]|uniref:porin n=1 Tax=Thalassobacter stenotrophicus TaxID=266809 RepID=UPI0022A97F35|nr:porin [Thalassobacter stenotrophicus]UYP67663.1 porin [Thalassobacter stenotrophicus]